MQAGGRDLSLKHKEHGWIPQTMHVILIKIQTQYFKTGEKGKGWGLNGKNLPQNKGQQSLETKRYVGKDSGIRTGLCHTAGMTLRDGQLSPERQVPDPLNEELSMSLRASNFW